MIQPKSEAKLNYYHQLEVGQTFERDYAVTRQVYEDFLKLFGDASPLHVDADYARACDFPDVLMHGAILNGFISNFVGMHFPGGRGMELSVDIRFLKPVWVEDVIRVQGKLAQKLDSHQVVVVHLSLTNKATGEAVASAKVQLKMMPV
jgi:3-hydroxybutyryl-CoA dehydratase